MVWLLGGLSPATTSGEFDDVEELSETDEDDDDGRGKGGNKKGGSDHRLEYSEEAALSPRLEDSQAEARKVREGGSQGGGSGGAKEGCMVKGRCWLADVEMRPGCGVAGASAGGH